MSNLNADGKSFKAVIATPDLPELGPTPRAGRLPRAELDQKLDRFARETRLAARLHAPVRAAALLWHDYLDESHTISQYLGDAGGSFLHGIMHRREPDYGNARYWFHRVGKHPCFPDIARQVTRLLETKGENALAAGLAPGGDWDPFAFVEACEKVAGRPSSDQRVQTLKSIQEIEFDCLLAHLLAF